MPSIVATRPDAAPLAACQATAWLLPLAAWRAHAEELLPLAPASAQRRFASIRHEARRRDRLLAAALHRLVLAQALELPASALPLYRSDAGQPRLALPGLHTSLAHADGVVAVALCEGGPVGVDVERRDVASLEPIADLVCAAGELAAMRGEVERDAGLLSLWVRKEALLKAAGVGLAFPMKRFHAAEGARVMLRDAQGRPLELTAHSRAHADCIAALAAPPGARLRWRWHTP